LIFSIFIYQNFSLIVIYTGKSDVKYTSVILNNTDSGVIPVFIGVKYVKT